MIVKIIHFNGDIVVMECKQVFYYKKEDVVGIVYKEIDVLKECAFSKNEYKQIYLNGILFARGTKDEKAD